MTRRDLVRLLASAPAFAGIAGLAIGADPEDDRYAMFADGKYVLPPLPYPNDALEAAIDAKTMQLHHDIHHLSYVNGLNKALDELAAARKSNDFSLVKHWEREVAFHGSGHILHSLFWRNMSPDGGGEPKGSLAEAISRDFGSFDAFKAQFSAAAKQVEGSGWGILALEPLSGRLITSQAEKHQNQAEWGVVPLLVIDVWEHAYYLRYQNNRSAYVDNWWKVVNWSDAENHYEMIGNMARHPGGAMPDRE